MRAADHLFKVRRRDHNPLYLFLPAVVKGRTYLMRRERYDRQVDRMRYEVDISISLDALYRFAVGVYGENNTFESLADEISAGTPGPR